MSSLEDVVGKMTLVATGDGRIIVGKLGMVAWLYCVSGGLEQGRRDISNFGFILGPTVFPDTTPLSLSGTLKGFDQTVNLILDDAHERVFSGNQGVEEVPLGLYLVRGDNV
eukprot:sb/3477213/